MNSAPAAAELVTVIVPTLNEADNIEPLLTRILEQISPALRLEVLFVDDRSTDQTPCASSISARLSRSACSQRDQPSGGLAGAVLAGAALAKSRLVLVMDADLSHPPERIGDLLAPLLDGSHDLVIGSRYVPGGRTPGWPWWRRFASRTASLLVWPLARLHDPLSGFFATERTSLTRCRGDASGFKIALEVIVNAPTGFRVREIPIVFRDRTRGQSKIRLRVLAIYLFRLVALLRLRLTGRIRAKCS